MIASIPFHTRETTHGTRVHELIAPCPLLDPNSLYCNRPQCTRFAVSPVIAEHADTLAGVIPATSGRISRSDLRMADRLCSGIPGPGSRSRDEAATTRPRHGPCRAVSRGEHHASQSSIVATLPPFGALAGHGHEGRTVAIAAAALLVSTPVRTTDSYPTDRPSGQSTHA